METTKNPIAQEFDAEFGEPTAPLTPTEEPKAEEAAPPAQPPDNPPQLIERVIDIGDGSGKQVFRAPSEAEFIEKMVQAHTHATRKIRQQAREIKQLRKAKAAEPPPAPPTPPVSAEQLLELAQDPTRLAQELVKQQAELAQVKAQLTQRQQQELAEQERAEAAREFVEDHATDYIPTQRNARLIQEKMQELGLSDDPEHYRDSLEAVFEEIQLAGGFPDKPQSVTAANTAGNPRIENAPPKKPVSTGVSDRENAPANPTPTDAQVVEELWNMPLHELRKRIQRRAYEANFPKPPQ